MVGRETWDTHVGVAGVLDRALMVGEEGEGVRASQTFRRTHSSSVRVLLRHSLRGAAACAEDIRELPTVVVSSLGLAGTSSRGALGVEGPRWQGPLSGLASELRRGPDLERGALH